MIENTKLYITIYFLVVKIIQIQKGDDTMVCEDHYLVRCWERKAEDPRSRIATSPPERNAGLVSKIHLHVHLVASVTYIHILHKY